MLAGRKPGGFYSRWIVDRRARTIEDPVARLRYLRRAMRPAHAWPAPVWRNAGRRRLVLGSVLILALTPLRIASDVPWGVEAEEILTAPPRIPMTAELPRVWLVDKKDGVETYSNGLRVEAGSAVAGERREYPVYDQSLDLLGWRSEKIGIVYHTTESHLAPFDPSYNSRLQRVGGWLLAYVRRNSSYHYLIDRFGRVHRVVEETDVANHAGYSVWSDGPEVYVNLNPSFIGISFETQTTTTEEAINATPAQVHAARILTQMLRHKYRIAARNCVTHAQVSVNQFSMLIGNHTDWAGNFPFGEMGLEENYGIPNPAMCLFGFRYGEDFIRATSAPIWKGVALGADLFRRQAREENSTVEQLRKKRRKRYKEILTVIEEAVASQESQS